MKKLLLCLLLIASAASADNWEETADNPHAICNPTIYVGTGVFNLPITVPTGCQIMKIYAQAGGGNSWNTPGLVGSSGGGGAAFFGVLTNVQAGEIYSVTAGNSASNSTEGGYGAQMKVIKGQSGTMTQANLIVVVGGGGGAGSSTTTNATPGPGGAGGFYGQNGGFGSFTYSRSGPAIAGGGEFGHVLGGVGGVGTPPEACNNGGSGSGGYSQIFATNNSGQGGVGGRGWYQGGGGAGCSYFGFPEPTDSRFAGGGGGGGSSKKGDFAGFDPTSTRFFDGSWNLPGGMSLPQYVPTYGLGGSDGAEYLGGAAHYRIGWGDITVAESRFPPGDFTGSEACANLSTTSHGVMLSDPPCGFNNSMTCRGDYDANGLAGPGTDAVCSYHCPANSDTYVFRVSC